MPKAAGALNVPAPALFSSLSNLELARVLGWSGKSLKKIKTSKHLGRSVRSWLPEEIAIIGKASDADIGRLLRRSPLSIQKMRVRLKISAYGYEPPRKWTASEIAMIGKHPDSEAAKMIGCSSLTVATKRKKLGIPYINPHVKKWTPEEEAMLGKFSDAEVARRTNRTIEGIKLRRSRKHILLDWSSRSNSARSGTFAELAKMQGGKTPPRSADNLPLGKKRRSRTEVPPSKNQDKDPVRRGPIFRPWTDEEFKLLGTKVDKEIGRMIGRSRGSVESMRLKWKIPLLEPELRAWTPREDKLLGTAYDEDLAAIFKRSTISVKKRRLRLRIPACSLARPRRKSAHHHLLGVVPDSEIMKLSGRTRASIKSERRRFGIPPASTGRFWKPHELKLLGTVSDTDAAKQLKRSLISIQSKRQFLRIPVFRLSPDNVARE